MSPPLPLEAWVLLTALCRVRPRLGLTGEPSPTWHPPLQKERKKAREQTGFLLLNPELVPSLAGLPEALRTQLSEPVRLYFSEITSWPASPFLCALFTVTLTAPTCPSPRYSSTHLLAAPPFGTEAPRAGGCLSRSPRGRFPAPFLARRGLWVFKQGH